MPVYWIVLNGMSSCRQCVDETKIMQPVMHVRFIFISMIICKHWIHFLPMWKCLNSTKYSVYNVLWEWNWIFVGIVIVFMTVVFTWCQQIFALLFPSFDAIFGLANVLTQQFSCFFFNSFYLSFSFSRLCVSDKPKCFKHWRRFKRKRCYYFVNFFLQLSLNSNVFVEM